MRARLEGARRALWPHCLVSLVQTSRANQMRDMAGFSGETINGSGYAPLTDIIHFTDLLQNIIVCKIRRYGLGILAVGTSLRRRA